MSIGKLIGELDKSDLDVRQWAADFAALAADDRVSLVRELRRRVDGAREIAARLMARAAQIAEEPGPDYGATGVLRAQAADALALGERAWAANFTLRSFPAFTAAAREILLALDPVASSGAEGDRDDDARVRALRADREWVEQRCRRGFILDGSPGAWRPRAGASVEAASGGPRSAPRHSIVSRGEWPQGRLIPDTMTRRDDTRTDVISVQPGERAAGW